MRRQLEKMGLRDRLRRIEKINSELGQVVIIDQESLCFWSYSDEELEQIELYKQQAEKGHRQVIEIKFEEV